MLKSMCQGNARLADSAIRMDRPELAYDYETLQALQEEYPEDDLYFVTGSDKLLVLPRWHCVEALIHDFRILVAKRGEDDLEKIKEIRPFIAEHWDRFAVFPVPDEILQISSSAFRERVHLGDLTASELVTENVWNLLNQYGKLPRNAIPNFHAEGYEFLSNFYPASVTYQGLTFQNNEAAFQAQKTFDESTKEQFTEFSPGKAKGVGRRVALRPDWEEVKAEIMYEIVLAKFTQHPELAEKLLETGDQALVEGNSWNDTCWGVNLQTGQGENRLGVILMRVREKLRCFAKA